MSSFKTQPCSDLSLATPTAALNLLTSLYPPSPVSPLLTPPEGPFQTSDRSCHPSSAYHLTRSKSQNHHHGHKAMHDLWPCGPRTSSPATLASLLFPSCSLRAFALTALTAWNIFHPSIHGGIPSFPQISEEATSAQRSSLMSIRALHALALLRSVRGDSHCLARLAPASSIGSLRARVQVGHCCTQHSVTRTSSVLGVCGMEK